MFCYKLHVPFLVLYPALCLAGLVFIAFGPSYSYSLIRLLYGQKWSDGEAATALRYYCFYVIVLAMNGNSLNPLLLNFLC